jgi:hypothetical protein
VAPPGEEACPEPLLPADITGQERSKLIELWMQDFARSLVRPKGECDAATILDSKPVLIRSGETQLTLFEYTAGTLDAKPAAHVIAKDGRAFRLLRETGVSADFEAAEQSVLQFAFREKQQPKQVLLLGKVGTDKLRFGFDADRAGLAGSNFVCPFDNPEVFSKVSPVVNAFLVSVNEKCQQADFQAGRVAFFRMNSSAGELDVVTAPRPGEPRSWSVHFGSPALPEDKVAAAEVGLPEGTDDAQAARLLPALARTWFEGQAGPADPGFASGSQFDLRCYCDNGAGIGVAVAADLKPGLFVTALDATSAPRFWLIGGAGEAGGDPFVDLGGEQGAAIALLRADLDLLAHGDRSAADAARAFCVVRHEHVTLWPRLSAAGRSSTIRALAYQELGKAAPASQISLLAEGLPTCGWLRETLGSYFRGDLKTLLAIGPAAAPREVWLGSASLSSETTYERAGMPECQLLSEVLEADTFAALDNRPARLACPTKLKLFKRVIGGQSPDLPARLVILDQSLETAWVAAGQKFKQIRMSGNDAAYTEAHWRLLEEGDLAADDARVSRMVPLESNEIVRLLVLMPSGPDALLSSRSLENDVPSKKDVRTLGLPADTDDPMVRAALDALEQRSTVPAGIVFSATGSSAVVQFWMLEDDPKTVGFFRGSGDQPTRHVLPMVNAAKNDIDGVMDLLSKADPRMAEAIERGDKGGTPPSLRIPGDALAVVTPAELLLQTGSKVQTVIFSPALAGLNPPTLPMLEPLIVLLSSDLQRCSSEPCPVGGGDQRFVLLDGKDALFGRANSPFGHAAIIGKDAGALMTMLERVLGLASDELFESQNGILILLPVGEGFFADPAKRAGLVFSPTNSRKLTLRQSLQKNPGADLSKALSTFDGHLTERLVVFPEGSALGLVKNDKRIPFVCGDARVTVLETRDWTIAADQADLKDFCSAIEKDNFRESEEGAWSLTKRDAAFVLFKQAEGSFSVRMWNALSDVDRKLALPFSPIASTDHSLEGEARNTAFACDAVSEVKAVGGGFWFRGKPGSWTCKLQLDREVMPMIQPTLLVEGVGPNGMRLTASVALPPQVEELAAVEGEILKALAARVVDANVCPTIEHVRATVDQGTKPVLLYDPDPAGSCRSVLAWRPNAAGAVQSLVGAADEIDALAPTMAANLSDLSGTSLFLEKFVKDAGIVVSDTDPQPATLTIVPFGSGAQPVARTRAVVDTAWMQICATYPLGSECPKVTALELAEAALRAKLHPEKGRTIIHMVDGRPNNLLSPLNLLDFWMELPND